MLHPGYCCDSLGIAQSEKETPVLLSGLDVGNTGALLIAMFVASVKAGLVLYFFMHLNHEPLIFKLFLGVAFFTLLAIFVLTFSDYSFRVIS